MESYVRPAEVRRGLGVSEATLYRMISARLLPKPVRITVRAVGWPQSELAILERARAAGKSDDEIRSLVDDLEAQRQGGVATGASTPAAQG